jgi:pimeloyl-ACP methyl ester carboxylesterase
MYLAGHSFGGATAFTYVNRHPGVFQCASLLDPAVDWAAHDLHSDILPPTMRDKCTRPAPAHRRAAAIVAAAAASVPRTTPLLMVYSESWIDLGWGVPHDIATLAQTGGLAAGSRACGLRGATHVAFSDVGMLLPRRMASALRLVRPYVPAERTPLLAAHLTLHFFDVLSADVAQGQSQGVAVVAAAGSPADFAAADRASFVIFPIPPHRA